MKNRIQYQRFCLCEHTKYIEANIILRLEPNWEKNFCVKSEYCVYSNFCRKMITANTKLKFESILNYQIVENVNALKVKYVASVVILMCLLLYIFRSKTSEYAPVLHGILINGLHGTQLYPHQAWAIS
jgi:hypothetical protein